MPGVMHAIDYYEVTECLKRASHQKRLQILLALEDGERSVAHLREVTEIRSQQNASQHLAVLRHGRLVESHRDGTYISYSLTDAGRKLVGMIRSFIA